MSDKIREYTTIQISDLTINPGQHVVARIPVGELPSGNKISIRAHVFRARWPGPVVLFLGGVHGDEINGVEIVRRSLEYNYFDELQRGTVIAIPLLNVYGFINYSRDVPDGKDVNRSFPGRSTGSLAARVAYTLHKQILPLVHFGVDFHTGGSNNYNYPQIRYTQGNEAAGELARAFGAPIILANKSIPKSLRRVAYDTYNVPLLVYEGGENLRYDLFAIEQGLAGIRRLLAFHEMIDTEVPPAGEQHVFSKSTWLRASRAGMFEWTLSSGKAVKKGDTIGRITDPHGIRAVKPVVSKHDGLIIGHNNAPVVSQGDALFHIAYA